MTGPLNHFLDWYNNLPKDHRIDISAIIGMSCPGFEKLDVMAECAELPNQFVEVISSCIGNAYKEVGMALTLRSSFELLFYKKRSDPDGWKETQAMMEELASTKESETFSRMANEVEFKAKQWVSTCEKWKELKKIYLTDDILEKHLILTR